MFISECLLHSKGQILRYSPGQGNPPCCIGTLPVGEGPERESVAHLLISRVLFNFHVRLGVSPTTAIPAVAHSKL